MSTDVRRVYEKIVIYKTRTGFTKQYAQWIAEEIDCEIVDYRNISSFDFNGYDLIIYGGRVHAGKIDELGKIKKMFANSKYKLVVFATGATPFEAKEEIKKIMANNFDDNSIPNFYMQSGLCYEKMSLPDKTIMKALSKILSNKNNKSKIEEGTVNAINKSYDISDKKFIVPLIKCIENI
ncbi:MAG: flavodoxin domain-containing protein [Anaerorhabdus sp.]|uniref:flavodoxin domain-containing protein n=1 Tax=Anaerorhabdus sp. TaxID=1872524 RepID=UPI002FCAFBF8